MIKTVFILVMGTLIVVPTALIVWRLIKRIRPKPVELPSNPEEFTHVHLDTRLSNVELMAAKRELQEKLSLLKNKQELALVQQEIARADSLLYDRQYPPDGEVAVQHHPQRKAIQ